METKMCADFTHFCGKFAQLDLHQLAKCPEASSKFVLALGEEQFMRAVIIRFRHEDICEAVQIAVAGAGVNEFLRGGDAVLFKHHHKQFRFHDRTGEEQFHAPTLNHG